jgi:hypothetical protein
MHKIKIFNMDGGITWVAAKDKPDAIKAMADLFSNGNLDEFANDYPETVEDAQEIDQKDYDGLEYVENFEESYANRENAITKTFRTKLNEMLAENPEQFPCFFATSEY